MTAKGQITIKLQVLRGFLSVFLYPGFAEDHSDLPISWCSEGNREFSAVRFPMSSSDGKLPGRTNTFGHDIKLLCEWDWRKSSMNLEFFDKD